MLRSPARGSEAELLAGSHGCHCEERSDEAISTQRISQRAINFPIVNPHLPGGSVKRSLAMVFRSRWEGHPQGLRAPTRSGAAGRLPLGKVRTRLCIPESQ